MSFLPASLILSGNPPIMPAHNASNRAYLILSTSCGNRETDITLISKINSHVAIFWMIGYWHATDDLINTRLWKHTLCYPTWFRSVTYMNLIIHILQKIVSYTFRPFSMYYAIYIGKSTLAPMHGRKVLIISYIVSNLYTTNKLKVRQIIFSFSL